jgi:hypothetical protein
VTGRVGDLGRGVGHPPGVDGTVDGDDAAELDLTPGVGDGVGVAGDLVGYPGPQSRVEGLGHGYHPAKGSPLPFGWGGIRPVAHPGEHGWRGQQGGDVVPVDDVPEPAPGRDVEGSFEHDRGVAPGEGAEYAVHRRGDPRGVPGAPEHTTGAERVAVDRQCGGEQVGGAVYGGHRPAASVGQPRDEQWMVGG